MLSPSFNLHLLLNKLHISYRSRVLHFKTSLNPLIKGMNPQQVLLPHQHLTNPQANHLEQKVNKLKYLMRIDKREPIYSFLSLIVSIAVELFRVFSTRILVALQMTYSDHNHELLAVYNLTQLKALLQLKYLFLNHLTLEQILSQQSYL